MPINSCQTELMKLHENEFDYQTYMCAKHSRFIQSVDSSVEKPVIEFCLLLRGQLYRISFQTVSLMLFSF